MAMSADAHLSAIPGLSFSWPRFGGLLGVIGVVLFVIGAALSGDVPIYTDDPGAIKAWFGENGDQFLLSDFIIGLGVVFGLVPFFVTVRAVMATAEGEGSLWPVIGLIGGLLFVITGAVASMFNGTLALNADALDESAVVALSTANFQAFNAPGFVAVLFFLATAMGIMRSGAFAAPIAWLCLLLSVTGILSGLASIDGDPEGLFSILGLVTTVGLGIVVLAIGGSLLMRKDA